MQHVSHSALQRCLIGVFLALACAGGALVVVLLTETSPQPPPSCAINGVSSTSEPACWRPFVAASPFNTELPAHPVLLTNSAAIVDRMIARRWTIDGSNQQFDFVPRFYGTRPLFFATASDPVMTIQCKESPAEGLCTGANRVDVSGMKIHVPRGAMPDRNQDSHMTVIETDTGAEYDFWSTSITGSTISAKTAAVVNVRTGDGRGSQGDAAQFALSAGLVRPTELASGEIDHALVVTVPCTDGHGTRVGFTWPAEGGYGAACGPNGSAADDDTPAMGQLLRLNLTDAQIRQSGAPAWQQTIMTAFAHFGAYVEDTDGSAAQGIDILAQSSSSWTDLRQSDRWASLLSRLGSSDGTLTSATPIPLADLEVVAPCVVRGGCGGQPQSTTSTAPNAAEGSPHPVGGPGGGPEG